MFEFHDLNDDRYWSELDVADLYLAIGAGETIEGAARFLSRAGTVGAVANKARQLGLEVSHDRAAQDQRHLH